MPRLFLSAVLLLLAWSAVAYTETSAERPWLLAQAGPIRVLSDAGENDARELLERMVRVRALVQRATGLTVGDSVEPLIVLAPRSSGGMRELVGAGASRNRSLTVAMSLPSPYSHHMAVRASARQVSHRVLLHEYVHVLIKDQLGEVPAWLDEGVAEFWSTLDEQEGEIVAGLPIDDHARRVRRGTLTRLPDLIRVPRGRYDQFSGSLQTFYAQSWSLVHFLQLRGESSAPDLAPEVPDDLPSLQAEWQVYVSGPYRVVRSDGHRAEPIVDRQLTTIPPDEALATRAHAMAFGEDLESARTVAQRALALNAVQPLALEVMGVIAFQRNSLDEARRWFGDAIRVGGSYRSHYYYGVLTAGTPQIASHHFRRALELRPDFKPALERLRALNGSAK